MRNTSSLIAGIVVGTAFGAGSATVLMGISGRGPTAPAGIAPAQAAPINGPRAAVLFECRRSGAMSLAPDLAPTAADLERYANTQAALMKSRGVLLKVASEPSVRDTHWIKTFNGEHSPSPVAAVENLIPRVFTRVLSGTGIIELTVQAEDPGEAACIANSIADVAADNARTAFNCDVTGLITLLNSKMKELDSDIRTLDNTIENILNTRNITSLDPADSALRVEMQALARDLESLRTNAAASPGGEGAANPENERLAAGLNRLARLRQEMTDEAVAHKQCAEFKATRDAKRRMLSNYEQRVLDLTAASQGGPPLRIIETPEIIIPLPRAAESPPERPA